MTTERADRLPLAPTDAAFGALATQLGFANAGAMVAALGAHLVARGAKPSTLDFGADSALPVTEVLV